ncbi:MAG: TolC family protein, partial [Thermoleophilia bacterium]|nr:TolC family protein [Thermoleophilia bacterium]
TVVLCLAAPMLLHGGCVSVTPDERFPDVARAIDERAAQRVHWRLGTPEDERVDAFVNELLGRPLTPESAVQVSLLRSRDLQAVYEDLGVAQADLVQAGLLKNPDFAGFFRFPDSGPKGVNWNVGLDFWLEYFVIPLKKRIAGAELEAALLRVTDAVLDKATRVRQAYFQYLADQQVLAQQRALADFAEVGAELSKRQRAQGHVAELEFATEQAAAEEAGLGLDRAEAAARISRETLRRLLDLTDSDIPWTIDESVAAIPGADPDAEALVATSLDRRMDLALLDREIQTQRLGLELDKKWFLTKGAVGAETERSSDGIQGTGPHFSVELPIFHQHQALYARREAQIRQAEDRLAGRRGAARAEVRIAAERMGLARRVADRYGRSIVPLRQKIVGLTQGEYTGMIVGLPALLTAKTTETTAVIGNARAVQDYWTARAELERAVGVKLPDLPSPVPTPSPMPAPKDATQDAMPDMPGMTKPAPASPVPASPPSAPPVPSMPPMPDMPGMTPK